MKSLELKSWSCHKIKSGALIWCVSWVKCRERTNSVKTCEVVSVPIITLLDHIGLPEEVNGIAGTS